MYVLNVCNAWLTCFELSVMLTESWMGRMSFSSRLPQYLTTAMLTGAVHVTTLCIFNSRWHYVHLKYPWTPLDGVLVSRGGRFDHDCNEMAEIGFSNNFSRILFCADTLDGVGTYVSFTYKYVAKKIGREHFFTCFIEGVVSVWYSSRFLLSICLDAFRVMQKKRRFSQSGEALSLYEMHITKFYFENFKLHFR